MGKVKGGVHLCHMHARSQQFVLQIRPNSYLPFICIKSYLGFLR